MKYWYVLLIAVVTLTVLGACQSTASDPLDGTSWSLTSLNGMSPIPERIPTASFEDGRVSGSSGCNSYGGTYDVDGEKLVIRDLASTLMACLDPEGIMEQEGEFLSALSNAQTFQLTDSQLEILTSDGKVLVFDR